MALVVDRPAAVRARRAVRRGDLARLREQLVRRRLAAQQLLGARDVDRREPDRAERDADVGDRAAVDPDGRRRGGDRPVAGAALDLLVRAAAARAQREPHLGEQLAVADRGHVGPDVEVVHPDDALAVGAADHGLRLDRRADRREVLGRVGLAQRAADRAAVAHDRVGDHVLGVAEEREVPASSSDFSRSTCRVSAPIRISSPCSRMYASSVEIVDVDQVLGVRQPELHHRQQAVPAGDDARLRAEPLQRRDRALDAGRALVLE